ncbi:unnamed protein product [Prorocentrum cordatum]|uniref:Solute carrier family 40 protein n=1 Tax=Prorocentrum cordatum TaxID=2364126 RepID=A0ABN9V6B4_9DINO|nr:unnamed protein product [Polarella glacialis]
MAWHFGPGLATSAYNVPGDVHVIRSRRGLPSREDVAGSWAGWSAGVVAVSLGPFVVQMLLRQGFQSCSFGPLIFIGIPLFPGSCIADVVSALLGAVANAKANEEGPRGGRAGGGAPCLRDLRRECALRGVASAGMGREAMASALASLAREGAPARELRRLCWLLGVDVEGVRDRAAVVGMLRAAAGGKAPP